jgi:phosphoglycolate phosphatase
VAIARRRAEERHGARLAPGDVVLIGDTPLDVAAAREGGAWAVGVASGPYGQTALIEAGADSVLADLTDTEAVVREVLAHGSDRARGATS